MKTKLLNRYTAVEGGCSYFGAVIAYLIISLIFGVFLGGAEKGSTAYVLLKFAAGILIQGCFLAAALIPAKGFHSRITHLPEKTSWVKCVLGGVIALICVAGFEGLALSFNTMLTGFGYADGSALDFSDGLVIALTVVQSVLFAPVCEELLFRGSVLSSLEVMGKKPGTRRTAFSVLLCGLLFALMHCNPTQTVYQFFLGCAAAYMTLRFGSLLPAIILHAVNNIVGILLCIPAVDGAIGGWIASVFSEGWSAAVFVTASVLLAVAAAFAIRAICRKFGEKAAPKAEIVDLSADERGGLMGGALVFVPAALICAAVWIQQLITGLIG